MRRIVLGTDGSTGATAALRWAIHEAVIHNASLTALYAWQTLDVKIQGVSGRRG